MAISLEVIKGVICKNKRHKKNIKKIEVEIKQVFVKLHFPPGQLNTLRWCSCCVQVDINRVKTWGYQSYDLQSELLLLGSQK